MSLSLPIHLLEYEYGKWDRVKALKQKGKTKVEVPHKAWSYVLAIEASILDCPIKW